MNSYILDKDAEPRPMSALDEALNRLAKVVEEADHVGSLLATTLRPVMRDVDHAPGAEVPYERGEDSNGHSPTVQRVNETAARLRVHAARLHDLVQSLDI